MRTDCWSSLHSRGEGIPPRYSTLPFDTPRIPYPRKDLVPVIPSPGQTNTSENITFPQLRLRSVNIAFGQMTNSWDDLTFCFVNSKCYGEHQTLLMHVDFAHQPVNAPWWILSGRVLVAFLLMQFCLVGADPKVFTTISLKIIILSYSFLCRFASRLSSFHIHFYAVLLQCFVINCFEWRCGLKVQYICTRMCSFFQKSREKFQTWTETHVYFIL